jgi:hypothetical protein
MAILKYHSVMVGGHQQRIKVHIPINLMYMCIYTNI